MKQIDHRIVILCVILHSIYAYEVHKANPMERLFINDIQDVYTFCRYHTLQYEIELKGVNEIKHKISESIEILTELCNNVRINRICLYTLREINELFGKLSEQSRTIPVSKMKSRNQALEQIVTIAEKTVILADATYHNLKQGVEHMQTLINFFAKQQNRLQDHIDYINFNRLAQLTEANLRSCTSFFDSMIELFIHKNFEHLTDIISKEALKKDITNISRKAKNESCTLPIEQQNLNINEILRVSEINSFETPYSYGIGIKIPTLNNESFRLLQPIPIPFSYKNESHELTTLYDYCLGKIVDSENSIHIIPISVEEKTECKIIIDKIMCHPKQPIQIRYRELFQQAFIQEYFFCVRQKLEDMITATYRCRIRRILNKNHIIRISKSEYFIYIIQPDYIKITCNQQETSRFINESTRIIDLNPQCTIETKENYLTEHENSPVKSIRKFAYPLTVPSISKFDLIEKENNVYDPKVSRDLQPDFTDLQDEIKKIRTAPIQTNELSSYPHAVELSIIITFYASILISLCDINLYFRYKQNIKDRWARSRETIEASTVNL